MKKTTIILALILLVGILFSGCFGPEPVPKPEPKKDFCTTKSDCIATCSYGCVNKEWMQGKPDCEALITFDCDCINNVCVSFKLEPKDETTEEEIDSLFDEELENLPDEDLSELEDELI